ncbi:hypothetical protein QZH41_012350, partial [Actinostola sp. cb2023]
MSSPMEPVASKADIKVKHHSVACGPARDMKNVHAMELEDSDCLEEVCEENEILDVEQCEVEIISDHLNTYEAPEIRKKSVTMAERKSLDRIEEEVDSEEEEKTGEGKNTLVEQPEDAETNTQETTQEMTNVE